WGSCRDHRELRPQAVASLRSRARFELASEDGNALAHPDESVPAAIAAPGAPSVVAHCHLEISVAVADDYLGPLRPRVLERVVKPLLDESVRREIDPGG